MSKFHNVIYLFALVVAITSIVESRSSKFTRGGSSARITTKTVIRTTTPRPVPTIKVTTPRLLPPIKFTTKRPILWLTTRRTTKSRPPIVPVIVVVNPAPAPAPIVTTPKTKINSTITNPFLKKHNITYSFAGIEKYYNNSEGLNLDVKTEMKKAFETWSKVIPLNFAENNAKNISADVKIIFGSNNLNNSESFNGTYSLTWKYNRILFNTDYKWKNYTICEKYNSKMPDLYFHGLKSIGYLIGLENSNNTQSIMNKQKLPSDSNGNYVLPILPEEDIKAAQKIYGSKNL
uniref:Peptidase M10 metallopeptidase domain-containing protein n=1 Tax=Panagrolaimus davidi TaxID=227884 RepID=A0A914Q6W8_9BILA